MQSLLGFSALSSAVALAVGPIERQARCMSKPANPGRKGPHGGSGVPDGLTPAQRAIRKAAEGLRNGSINPPPPVAEGNGVTAAPPPAATAWPPPAEVDDTEAEDDSDVNEPVRHRAPAMTGPLFDVDEIYVGCPAIDQILAYRDRDFNVLATVERKFTDDSKIDALLAGDGIRHIDEHWVVCQDDQPVFSVERYLPAELPSYAVIDPTGTPLGAFVCSGGLIRRDVVVREGGSAPVAVIHVAHHRHVITETDGDEVGWCWRAFSGVGDDENEVWGQDRGAARSPRSPCRVGPRHSSATSCPTRDATSTATARWPACLPSPLPRSVFPCSPPSALLTLSTGFAAISTSTEHPTLGGSPAERPATDRAGVTAAADVRCGHDGQGPAGPWSGSPAGGAVPSDDGAG